VSGFCSCLFSNKENLTVVSLRNVNMDIRKMLPMLSVKELYDKKKKDNYKNHSLHIIVDEAHNILSSRLFLVLFFLFEIDC
jgi:hypothetical protein